jgi:hypothetical protein
LDQNVDQGIADISTVSLIPSHDQSSVSPKN